MDSAARQLFRREYGQVPAHVACAPGTLELLGCQADVHEGILLAAAIDRHVEVAVSPRTDGRVELVTAGATRRESFWLTDLKPHGRDAGGDAVRGILRRLGRKRVHYSGFSAAITSSVPLDLGAGEVEALGVALALAVRLLFPFSLTESGADVPPRRDTRGRLPPLTLKERILLARWLAENGREAGCVGRRFSRLLAGLVARAWQVTSIDCRFATVDYAPLVGATLVVCDSGVRRAPAGERDAALREVWRDAARALMAKTLRSVELSYLRANRHRLTARQHACVYHVVGETQRVVHAERALREDDQRQFGQYWFDSHASLRDHLGISCAELDLLVELARAHPGCLGARMSGEGLGGATVNLVAYHQAADFVERLAVGYQARTGRLVRPLVCQLVDGAG